MRKYKITFLIAIVLMVMGLCKINLNLNRQIYSTIAGYSNYKNNLSETKSWNLDHMEDVLTYPEKYNIRGNKDKEGIASVPRIRILFNNKPFDFRIDTDKYVFFINMEVFHNINSKFRSLTNSFRKKTAEVWNIIEG